MGDVAEFVEQRHHLVEFEQGRELAGGRREISHDRRRGQLVGAVFQFAPVPDAEAGRVLVFALAREKVEIEIGGHGAVRVLHLVSAHVLVPDRQLRRHEARAEHLAEHPEHPVHHGLQREILLYLFMVDGVLALFEQVVIIAGLPGIQRLVAVPFQFEPQPQLLAPLLLELGLGPLQEGEHVGAVLGHPVVQDVIGERSEAQQFGDLAAQGDRVLHQLDVHPGTAVIVEGLQPPARVPVLGVLHERHVVRVVHRHQPAALPALLQAGFEIFGQAFQLLFGQLQRVADLAQVLGELQLYADEFLHQFLDLVLLARLQPQAVALEIQQRFFQQAGFHLAELFIFPGVFVQRGKDVLAREQVHRVLADLQLQLLAGLAQRLVVRHVGQQDGHLHGFAEAADGVFESQQGVLKVPLRRGDGGQGLEPGLKFGDHGLGKGFYLLGGIRKIGRFGHTASLT